VGPKLAVTIWPLGLRLFPAFVALVLEELFFATTVVGGATWNMTDRRLYEERTQTNLET